MGLFLSLLLAFFGGGRALDTPGGPMVQAVTHGVLEVVAVNGR